MLPHWELLGRIALGALLGGAIGYERNLHSRHAVLRTHIVVAMASAAFMVVSAYFALYQEYDGAKHVEVDASRIAASVVSGIGFLAGGVIMKSGASVQGLTTASGLWLATAVGLMAGAGMSIEAVGVSILGIGALSFLRRFEEKKVTFLHRKVAIVMVDEPEGMARLVEAVTSVGVRVSGFEYERHIDEKKVTVKFEAHVPTQIGVDPMMKHLETQPGIKQVKIKQANS